MRAEMRAHQSPDQSGPQRLPNEAEMRRPAPVLINRQPDPARVGQTGESFADVQIDDEWLLAQNMFACSKRLFDDFDSILRMRRDVDDLDLVAPQQFAVIGRDRRVRIKLLLIGASFAFRVIAERGDAETSVTVRVQVLYGYAAASDDSDRRIKGLGISRLIRQDRRFDPRASLRFAQSVIVRQGFGHICFLFARTQRLRRVSGGSTLAVGLNPRNGWPIFPRRVSDD